MSVVPPVPACELHLSRRVYDAHQAYEISAHPVKVKASTFEEAEELVTVGSLVVAEHAKEAHGAGALEQDRGDVVRHERLDSRARCYSPRLLLCSWGSRGSEIRRPHSRTCSTPGAREPAGSQLATRTCKGVGAVVFRPHASCAQTREGQLICRDTRHVALARAYQ